MSFQQELEALISTFRNEDVAMWGEEYSSFKDVQVWSETKTQDQGHGYNVALSVDGSGYDELSANGCRVLAGNYKFRNRVSDLAERHGLYAGDQNSTLIVFYAA